MLGPSFTLGEVTEALKKNGYEHIRNSWFNSRGGACLLGQGALNLGMHHLTLSRLERALNKLPATISFVHAYAGENLKCSRGGPNRTCLANHRIGTGFTLLNDSAVLDEYGHYSNSPHHRTYDQLVRLWEEHVASQFDPNLRWNPTAEVWE